MRASSVVYLTQRLVIFVIRHGQVVPSDLMLHEGHPFAEYGLGDEHMRWACQDVEGRYLLRKVIGIVAVNSSSLPSERTPTVGKRVEVQYILGVAKRLLAVCVHNR